MSTKRIGTVHHLLTYGALVLLATMSLLIGTQTHWPYVGVMVGLGIAALKTLLVLAVFMHLAEQSLRPRLAVAVAAVLLLTLVALTAADVATRTRVPAAPRPMGGEGFYVR